MNNNFQEENINLPWKWEKILEKGIVAIATIVIGLVGIVILFFRYRV